MITGLGRVHGDGMGCWWQGSAISLRSGAAGKVPRFQLLSSRASVAGESGGRSSSN